MVAAASYSRAGAQRARGIRRIGILQQPRSKLMTLTVLLAFAALLFVALTAQASENGNGKKKGALGRILGSKPKTGGGSTGGTGGTGTGKTGKSNNNAPKPVDDDSISSSDETLSGDVPPPRDDVPPEPPKWSKGSANKNGGTGGKNVQIGNKDGKGNKKPTDDDVPPPPEDQPPEPPKWSKGSVDNTGKGPKSDPMSRKQRTFPMAPPETVAAGNIPAWLLNNAAFRQLKGIYHKDDNDDDDDDDDNDDAGKLGQGGFGSVHKFGLVGSAETRHPAMYAIKEMRYVTDRGTEHNSNKLAGATEDQIFAKINGGPFVVRSYGSWLEKDNTGKPIAKKTAYGLASGDLRKYIPNMSVEDIRLTFARIVYGVAFLHWHGIMHRDLKTANILIGADGMPRIADFGQSVFKQWLSPATGKNRYLYFAATPDLWVRSPEIEVLQLKTHKEVDTALAGKKGEAWSKTLNDWLDKAPTESYFAEEPDLWSLGTILFEMFVGGRTDAICTANKGAVIAPYVQSNCIYTSQDFDKVSERLVAIANGEAASINPNTKSKNPYVNLQELPLGGRWGQPTIEQAKDLIEKLMDRDPSKRLGAPKRGQQLKDLPTETLRILEHPFFSRPASTRLKPITLAQLQQEGQDVAIIDSQPIMFLPKFPYAKKPADGSLPALQGDLNSLHDPRFKEFSAFNKDYKPRRKWPVEQPPIKSDGDSETKAKSKYTQTKFDPNKVDGDGDDESSISSSGGDGGETKPKGGYTDTSFKPKGGYTDTSFKPKGKYTDSSFKNNPYDDGDGDDESSISSSGSGGGETKPKGGYTDTSYRPKGKYTDTSFSSKGKYTDSSFKSNPYDDGDDKSFDDSGEGDD